MSNNDEFKKIVDIAATRIKEERGRCAQDVIYDVSEEYCVDIKELARELGKRNKRKGGGKMKVECEVELTQEEDDFGTMRECVKATCTRCGHETMSWGHGEGSIKRCLALMREECEEGEQNFYVEG